MALELKKFIHYIGRAFMAKCGSGHIHPEWSAKKFLADFVNKFTFRPGSLIKDEIIIPSYWGNNYWLAKKLDDVINLLRG